MTLSDLAGWLNLSWDTVKDVVKRRLEKDYRRIGYRQVRRIAIDELYLGRSHKYVTLVMDMGKMGSGSIFLQIDLARGAAAGGGSLYRKSQTVGSVNRGRKGQSPLSGPTGKRRIRHPAPPGKFGKNSNLVAISINAASNGALHAFDPRIFYLRSEFEDAFSLEFPFNLMVRNPVTGDDLEFPRLAGGNFQFVAKEG